MNLNFRKTLLLVLFFTAVVLLITNVIFNLTGKKTKTPGEELSKGNFTLFFNESLTGYGIDESQIKLSESNEDDTTYYNYKVSIAPSFPITLFINDMKNVKTDEAITVTSYEKGIGGVTTLFLRGNNRVIKAEFTMSKEIKREGDTLYVFADCSSLTDEELIKYVKDLTINFSVLIKPSVAAQVTAAKMLEMKKKYNLVFDDNIAELKYKLEAGFSQRRVADVMNNLNLDFPEAGFYYITDTPELNTVPINKEASKFNKVVLNNIGIKTITEENDLEFLFKPKEGYKKYYLVMEPDVLKDLEGVFQKLVKRGDKILN